MTMEELFIEEYKNLKEENELLKDQIKNFERALENAAKRNAEFRALLATLQLQISKSNFSGKKYIPIGIVSIYEGDRFYDLLSEFAKEDEPKKEDEK